MKSAEEIREEMSSVLVWFRKDLRIHDHEPLTRALSKGKRVIAFYCFERTEFGKTSFGFQKTDSFRAQFLIESVQDLRENLEKIGLELIVRLGETNLELEKICNAENIDTIYAYKDIHQEEIRVQQKVEQIGIPLDYAFGSTLFHVNDIPYHYSEIPNVFTQFRKGVEKKSKARALLPYPKRVQKTKGTLEKGELPTLEELGLLLQPIDEKAAIIPIGGETAALKRLHHYLHETNEVSFYKEKRNGLIGIDYSSKLSLWLWNGCISPRKIYWELKKYEKEVISNQSTYWLLFELIWRDYFKYISLKFGNKIFWKNGIKKEGNEGRLDFDKFNKWAQAETGIPFIDANMRELNQTGFMSNRGRQNVASFLTKELGLDWRLGAEYFESKLIDYDVASNYGNWMYNAGVGNDPRDRYFNIMVQAKRYDSEGEYVKRWIPELNQVDASIVHHPWTRNGNLFESEINYRKPMVEPDYWKKYYS